MDSISRKSWPSVPGVGRTESKQRMFGRRSLRCSAELQCARPSSLSSFSRLLTTATTQSALPNRERRPPVLPSILPRHVSFHVTTHEDCPGRDLSPSRRARFIGESLQCTSALSGNPLLRGRTVSSGAHMTQRAHLPLVLPQLHPTHG